jgi:hypothetical protein
MAMHREVARRALGRLVGGDEGSAMTARAEDWMRREGVADADRLTAALAPGLEETSRVD